MEACALLSAILVSFNFVGNRPKWLWHPRNVSNAREMPAHCSSGEALSGSWLAFEYAQVCAHTHTHTLTHIAPLYLVTTTEKVISTTILSVRPCSVKELMRQSLWTYNSSQMQTLGCQLNSFSNAICGMRAPSVWFGLRESEPAVAYELRCVIQLLLLQL